MRPLNLLLVIILCFTSPAVFSQTAPVDNFYLLDADNKGTADTKKAKYIYRERKFNDTCWQYDTYNFLGPLIKTEQFKNNGEVAHGEFLFYRPSGMVDSIITFVNGLAHGSWYYVNDTGRFYLRKEYDRGKLLYTVDLIKKQDENKDTVKDKDNRESMFPGITGSWARYLNRNLRYPERAINANIEGKVMSLFVVTVEGKIKKPQVFRSVEYSVDNEAMRIIQISPDWEPALKFGKKIEASKLQPVLFRLQ